MTTAYLPPPHPAPRRSRNGQLIAGAAGAAVLLLFAAVVIVVAITRGSAEAPGPVTTGVAPTGAASTGGSTYRPVPDLCGGLDLAPMRAILPNDEFEDTVDHESDHGTSWRCTFRFSDDERVSFAKLRLEANVYDVDAPAGVGDMSQHLAVEMYKDCVEGGGLGLSLAETSERVQDLDGPWREGTVFLGRSPATPPEVDPQYVLRQAGACVVDGNLYLQATVGVDAAPGLTDPPTDDDLAEVVRGFVDGVVDALTDR